MRLYPSPVDALLTPQLLPMAGPGDEAALDSLRSFNATRVALVGSTSQAFQPRRSAISAMDLLLVLLFLLLPAGLGVYYYGFYATDQYVSEFRFSVVDTSSPTPAIAGGLASVLGGAGLGSGNTDSYTVTDYLTSPQAIMEVEKSLPLRKIFSDPKADWFFRLDPKASQEKLARYWPWMVSSYYDPVTGIASAQVRAFSSENAFQVATTLLQSAEKLVNDMQTRQRADTIRFAQEALDRDKADLAKIRREMLALRTQSGYIEPSASGVAENTALATSLRLSITNQQIELSTLNSSAPVAKILADKIAASKKQLAVIDREISTKSGDSGSGALSTVVGKFDDLTAEQAAATAIMSSDLVSLQQAKAQADAQHIYLSTYVHPARPTTSVYPNRPTGIAFTILAALGLFCFAKLVATAIRGHAV